MKINNLLNIATRHLFGIIRKVTPSPLKKFARKILRIKDSNTIKHHQKLLSELLNEERGKHKQLVIFPPSLDWDVQLFQRPQQLALALGRQGALVFYLQPKPDRKQPPFQLIEKGVYLCNVHVDTFSILTNPFIYLLTWNSDYANCFDNPRIIYDFVDDIDVFYGDRDQIARGHQYLLKNAHIVLATANKLVEEAKLYRSDVIYSPNGVVYEHFARAARNEFSTPPEDLAPIVDLNQPIIGYYGALARWFDYDLLKQIALSRPHYRFVLIGPDYDGTLRKTDLLDIPNILWLGVKPYKELPHYLQYFDVATIPFIVNEITHATSPLKLFEYMAAEKPIVITPMRESMNYPGVLIAHTPEEFATRLDHALRMKDDIEYRELMRKIALENTWDERAKVILEEGLEK
ncbi:MAG: glycosyltransferase [Chloroflexota bacterium]